MTPKPPLKATTWSPSAFSLDLFCVSAQCPNKATHGPYCYPHSLSTHTPKMNWEVDA